MAFILQKRFSKTRQSEGLTPVFYLERVGTPQSFCGMQNLDILPHSISARRVTRVNATGTGSFIFRISLWRAEAQTQDSMFPS